MPFLGISKDQFGSVFRGIRPDADIGVKSYPTKPDAFIEDILSTGLLANLSKLDWRRKRRTPSRNRGNWFWTGAPCSPERTWAENGFFQCSHSMGKDSCSWPQCLRRIAKAFEGAAPRLFQPMYAWANMGHPSREEGFSLRSHHSDADELREGCHPT